MTQRADVPDLRPGWADPDIPGTVSRSQQPDIICELVRNGDVASLLAARIVVGFRDCIDRSRLT